MDRRVTPPKRVTSPTWGSPPPCKQALSIKFKMTGMLFSIVHGQVEKTLTKTNKKIWQAHDHCTILTINPQAANRQFSSSPGPLYQNEVKCSAFDMEKIFHKKGFASGLILKERVFRTRKWPIARENVKAKPGILNMLQSASVFIAAEKRAIRSTFQVFVSELARVISRSYKQCGKVSHNQGVTFPTNFVTPLKSVCLVCLFRSKAQLRPVFAHLQTNCISVPLVLASFVKITLLRSSALLFCTHCEWNSFKMPWKLSFGCNKAALKTIKTIKTPKNHEMAK